MLEAPALFLSDSFVLRVRGPGAVHPLHPAAAKGRGLIKSVTSAVSAGGAGSGVGVPTVSGRATALLLL